MGLLVRVALAVAANAVALLLAALLLDGVEGTGSTSRAFGWVLATLIVWLATVVYSMVSVGLQRSVVGKLRPRSGAS